MTPEKVEAPSQMGVLIRFWAVVPCTRQLVQLRTGRGYGVSFWVASLVGPGGHEQLSELSFQRRVKSIGCIACLTICGAVVRKCGSCMRKGLFRYGRNTSGEEYGGQAQASAATNDNGTGAPQSFDASAIAFLTDSA